LLRLRSRRPPSRGASFGLWSSARACPWSAIFCCCDTNQFIICPQHGGATAEQETASQTTLIQKDIVIIQKNEEKLLSEEKLATAQEKTNEAVIRAETVRLKGIKEREKEIAIIEANQKAEAIQIQVETQAKADARKNQLEAEAHLFKINKEAEAMERLALAKEKNYVVEAEGILKRNEAENKLDAKIIEYKQKMKLIEKTNLENIKQ
jgi:hypothetical protein